MTMTHSSHEGRGSSMWILAPGTSQRWRRMEATLKAGQRRRKRVSEGDEGLRTGVSLEVEFNPNDAGAVVDTGDGSVGGGGGGNCLGRTERPADRLGSEMASDGRLGLKLVSIDCIVDHHHIDRLNRQSQRKLGFLPITTDSKSNKSLG